LLTTLLDVAGAFASAVPAAVSVTANAAKKTAKWLNSFRDNFFLPFLFSARCGPDRTKLPPPMLARMPESDRVQMKKVPTKPSIGIHGIEENVQAGACHPWTTPRAANAGPFRCHDDPGSPRLRDLVQRLEACHELART